MICDNVNVFVTSMVNRSNRANTRYTYILLLSYTIITLTQLCSSFFFPSLSIAVIVASPFTDPADQIMRYFKYLFVHSSRLYIKNAHRRVCIWKKTRESTPQNGAQQNKRERRGERLSFFLSLTHVWVYERTYGWERENFLLRTPLNASAS